MSEAILKKMQEIAEKNGAILSKNAKKICKIKENNIDEYACPCYPDDKEHYCMSQLCKTQYFRQGLHKALVGNYPASREGWVPLPSQMLREFRRNRK